MRGFPFAHSLRARILLIVLLAALPALGLILQGAAEQRRHETAELEAQALSLARGAASGQELVIADARALLTALAHLPQVRSADSAACDALFAELLAHYPRYRNLRAARPNGDVFCSAVPTTGRPNIAELTHFRRALQTRDFAIGDCLIGHACGRPTIAFGYPSLDEAGEVQSVVMAVLDLDWVNQLAPGKDLAPGSTLTVFDHRGTIVVRHPDPDRWVGQPLPDAPLVRTVLARGEGVTELPGVDGLVRLYGFTAARGAPGARGPADDEGLHVAVGIPSEVVAARVDGYLASRLAGLGAAALLALVVAWLGGDLLMLRQVSSLAAVAKRLGAGDWGARADLVHGAGELRQLAVAFNQMAEAIGQRTAERARAEVALRESQRRLATLVDNLPGVAYRCVYRPDSGWWVEYVSEGCLELAGYRPEELVNRPLLWQGSVAPPGQQQADRQTVLGTVVLPDDQQMVRTAVLGAIERREAHEIECRFLTKSGEQRWVWGRGRGVYADDGQVLALEGLLIDVTDRKLAEGALRWESGLNAALAELSRALISTGSIEEVSSLVLEHGRRLTDSPDGYVGYVDPRTGDLICPTMVTAVGHSYAFQNKGIAFQETSGLWGWVLSNRQPILTNQAAEDPRSQGTPRGHVPIERFVSAPAAIDGRVVGQVALANSERDYTERDLGVVERLAALYAVAIDRRWAEERIRKEAAQIRALARVAAELNGQLDLQIVLDALCEQAARGLGVAAAVVRLYDERQDQLSVAAQCGLPPEYREHARPVPRAFFEGHSPQESSVFVIPDVRAVSAAPNAELFDRANMRTVVGAKVTHEGRLLGVLTAITFSEPRHFDDDELAWLQGLADQAAVAIHNAQLFEQVQLGRERLQALSRRLVEVQEAERRQIARELHDEVGQLLTSLKLALDRGLRSSAGPTTPSLEEARAFVGDLVARVRNLSLDLRPGALDDLGLLPALLGHFERYTQQTGLRVGFRQVGLERRFPSEVETAAYRIVQEALTNVARHAGVDEVAVRLWVQDGVLSLQIEDQGVGFDVEAAFRAGRSSGLAGMRERAGLLGGSLIVESAPGSGTSLLAEVPLGGFAEPPDGRVAARPDDVGDA